MYTVDFGPQVPVIERRLDYDGSLFIANSDESGMLEA